LREAKRKNKKKPTVGTADQMSEGASLRHKDPDVKTTRKKEKDREGSVREPPQRNRGEKVRLGEIYKKGQRKV